MGLIGARPYPQGSRGREVPECASTGMRTRSQANFDCDGVRILKTRKRGLGQPPLQGGHLMHRLP